MLKIWIDGYEANIPQRLGSGQVAFELLKNIEQLDQENEYTVVLPSHPLPDLPPIRPGWKYKILKPKLLWTKIALPLNLYLTKEKPDIFYSPSHYIPQFSPVKCIATIFDLSFLHFPNLFEKKDHYKLINWSKFSILKSAHLITISNFTKKDIVQKYKIEKNKITVAYPGYNKQLFKDNLSIEQAKEIAKKYNIEGKYVIFIGTLQPRKNVSRLIEAIAKIEGLKLLIVGKTKGSDRSGWMYQEILDKPKELGIEKRVVFSGFIPTTELPYLIKAAEALVLPSLWEGFGIPVVEAMAVGTPVVVSDVSSLPEVVGGAGLLVDPKSVDQIEQALRLITTDKKLHSKMSKLGIIQAKKFSWKKMTKVVLEVFEEVGSK